MTSNPLLRIANPSVAYRQRGEWLDVLREVSLQVAAGQTYGLVGESGSGKSTLMHILGFLDKATSGTYLYGGEDVSTLDDDELAYMRGVHVGFVFQTFNLLARTDALENVEIPLLYDRSGRRLATHRLAEDALVRVGLGDRLTHEPGELSGGQQQRVAIARAVAKNPAVLLCDEPTGALDSKTGVLVLEALERANRELGTTTALITHNAGIAGMADRVVHIMDGRISSVQRNAQRRPARELSW